MLTGLPPFYTRDRERLFDRIRHAELKFPVYVSVIAKELLQALLNRDPNRRLGGGVGDGSEVKDHQFFTNVDWAAVSQRKIRPPFKPSISPNGGDVKYFEKEFVDLPVVNSDLKEPG